MIVSIGIFLGEIRTHGITQGSYTTCPEEIWLGISEMSDNKSCGLDSIPAKVFKYTPFLVYTWISCLVNMILTHLYVTCAMPDVKIVLILKNITSDPTKKSNYGLDTMSTSGSKVPKQTMFAHLEGFLVIICSQFWFKSEHSADMCTFALKETINYYGNLNTLLYTRFLNIKGFILPNNLFLY